jgi:hypothetical protein
LPDSLPLRLFVSVKNLACEVFDFDEEESIHAFEEEELADAK